MSKVGKSGRDIAHHLWGSKGRPESNAYAELCAERICSHMGDAPEPSQEVDPRRPAHSKRRPVAIVVGGKGSV